MTITVEDGSGLAAADSYLSIADADTYHTAHSDDAAWSGATDAVKEKALRLATQYLDVNYTYQGIPVDELQALDWPRHSVISEDGSRILSATTLPQALKDACAELALRQIADTDLIADQTNPYSITEESVQVGSIKTSTKYGNDKAQSKKYTVVDKLVRPLRSSGVARG